MNKSLFNNKGVYTTLEFINMYKENGLSFFPLQQRGKVPLFPWIKFASRLPTDEEISYWLEQYQSCNWAIATGKVSGIVVLDVDGPLGESSLADLGEMPTTPLVQTGRGRHYYFAHPGFDVRNGVEVRPGLDIRGERGYVVAPPSVHENGTPYTWEPSPEKAPFVGLPTQVVEALNERRTGNALTPKVGGASVPNSIRQEVDQLFGQLAQSEEGARNDNLNAVSFQLGRYVGSGALDRQWVESQLTRMALRTGLNKSETNATIASGLNAGVLEPKGVAKPRFTLLDGFPEVLDRPIRLIRGKAYGVTWLPAVESNDESGKAISIPVVFDADGNAYSNSEFEGSRSQDELGFVVDLPHQPDPDKILSPSGFKKMLAGDWPDPAETFKQTSECVDAFVSFEGSFADQQTMCDLSAAWVFQTYLLDAFNVVGYPWPLGEKGSGKTQFLNTLTALACLGRTITSGSTFASIRDEAHYGAAIALDDCENVRELESHKREMLLAGNTRGTRITLKEEAPSGGGYRTRYVNNYAPRAFSSISLPDPVLGSRAIAIPLIASTDRSKTRRWPRNSKDWPYDVRGLIDALWLVAVKYLSRVEESNSEASERSKLEARAYDIWSGPLAVAWWLDRDHGYGGLFDRLTDASEVYQDFNTDYSGPDLIGYLIVALHEILIEHAVDSMTLSVSQLRDKVDSVARRDDEGGLAEPVDAQKLGRLLSSLRFEKTGAHGKSRSRVITRQQVDQIAKVRGIKLTPIKDMLFPWSSEESIA